MKRLHLLICFVAAIGMGHSPAVSTCLAAEQFITQPKKRTAAPVDAQTPQVPTPLQSLVIQNHSATAIAQPNTEPEVNLAQQPANNPLSAETSQGGVLWVKRDRKGTSQTTKDTQSATGSSGITLSHGGPTLDYRLPSHSPSQNGTSANNWTPSSGRLANDQHRVALSPNSGTTDAQDDRNEQTTRSAVTAFPTGYPIPSATPTLHDEASESHSNRMKLASVVSKRILGQQEATPKPEVSPLQTTLGWNAVGTQLKGHLEQCTELTRRGVFASAREEAQTALLQLTRHLDQLSNRFVSEPCLQAAQTAMREAECFTDAISAIDPDVLRQISDSHITPILKQSEVQAASPLTLSQHYYRYAEGKLVEASQGHPWYSEILYGLGRAYQAEAELAQGQTKQLVLSKALVYYQAAVTILPKNALAANQLGYVLLQLDRPAEAQKALIASVDIHPDSPALQNLAEASRRLGDRRLEDWALLVLGSQNKAAEAIGQVPKIEMVDNRTFVAISPMTIGPKSAPQIADAISGQPLKR
jgi:tetratricopeptide (TPR) repeat protein